MSDFNAKDFANRRADIFMTSATRKGKPVIINHDKYSNLVFELTARDRQPLKDEVKDDE